MTTIQKNAAFRKLLEYEKRATRFAPGGQGGGGTADEWSGVVFKTGGLRLTCNINRIGEILPCPSSTPVPGAKQWIIGLANVRGELLTIVDLNGFLTGDGSTITQNSRLLTATINKAPIGLLVDEVFGQRHFLESEAETAELDDVSPFRGVVNRKHVAGSETWHEFDIERLFSNPEFLNGAEEY